MKTYTIGKGRHTSLKAIVDQNKLCAADKFRKLVVEVEVLPESIYKLQDDQDLIHDWNKFPGVSAYIWPSNKTFATLAFRSTSEGTLQVVPYANLNDEVNRKFPPSIPDSIFEFKVGDKFYYEIELQEPNLIVSLFQNENDLLTSDVFKAKAMSKYIRTTALWFGGYDNDGNKLGGVAPSKLKYKLKHKIYKT